MLVSVTALIIIGIIFLFIGVPCIFNSAPGYIEIV